MFFVKKFGSIIPNYFHFLTTDSSYQFEVNSDDSIRCMRMNLSVITKPLSVCLSVWPYATQECFPDSLWVYGPRDARASTFCVGRRWWHSQALLHHKPLLTHLLKRTIRSRSEEIKPLQNFKFFSHNLRKEVTFSKWMQKSWKPANRFLKSSSVES